MKNELFDELVEALSEDFSAEELSDKEAMQKTLSQLLEVTPYESELLIKAALEIKRVKGEVTPYWRRLLNIH
jgi:hypothetical protein